MRIFYADNKFFDYMGRIDLSVHTAPQFFYAGSMVRFRFTGTSLSVILNRFETCGSQWITAVIDGKEYYVKSDFADNGIDIVVNFTDDLEDTVHTACIVKRHETNERFIFKGAIVKNLIPPAFEDDLKIEVFGDSVCAGELTELSGFDGCEDPENTNLAYDNVLHSFVMIAAKNLNAKIHNNSQGGLALLSGTGWFHMPDLFGLEDSFDKMCYVSDLGKVSKWDFTRYIPDVVIIEVAQNDSHNGITDTIDLSMKNPEHKKRWSDKYKEIVRTLHSYYKTAKYIFTTTILNHEEEWDKTLIEISDELNKEGIKCYKNTFTNNGCGTPGHPRASEQQKMADELTAFIREKILK
ncbi:MAG: electron transporter RnfD [Ruminococcus sp.]|jgi:hypothetical protein|nr:electron transporter RnfD [Ruminococcus sp.]